MKTGLAILFAWFLCLVAQADTLTEQEIDALQGQVDAAIQRQDADALQTLLDPDVSITMIIHDGTITDTLHYTRAEFIRRLKETWQQVKDYQYQRRREQIEINGARATVSNTVLESMTIDGQRVRIQSREVAEVVKEAGRLRVLRITSQVGM